MKWNGGDGYWVRGHSDGEKGGQKGVTRSTSSVLNKTIVGRFVLSWIERGRYIIIFIYHTHTHRTAAISWKHVPLISDSHFYIYQNLNLFLRIVKGKREGIFGLGREKKKTGRKSSFHRILRYQSSVQYTWLKRESLNYPDLANFKPLKKKIYWLFFSFFNCHGNDIRPMLNKPTDSNRAICWVPVKYFKWIDWKSSQDGSSCYTLYRVVVQKGSLWKKVGYPCRLKNVIHFN